MIRANGKKSAFTLIELLVVIAMIALLMTSVATSVAGAQERARIQKATSDVKVITQAILAYENYDPSHELPANVANGSDIKADKASLKFLLGEGGSSASGQPIPALLMAVLGNGNEMRDPWGHPYYLRITPGKAIRARGSVDVTTGYFLPNAWRLTNGDRTTWKKLRQ